MSEAPAAGAFTRMGHLRLLACQLFRGCHSDRFARSDRFGSAIYTCTRDPFPYSSSRQAAAKASGQLSDRLQTGLFNQNIAFRADKRFGESACWAAISACSR